MAFMKKVSFIFDIHLPNPELFCIVFEDNQSFISGAKSNKLLPRTKNIVIKYYHFQSFVQKNIIWICYNYIREQRANVFIKPLDEELFIYLRSFIWIMTLKVKYFIRQEGF